MKTTLFPKKKRQSEEMSLQITSMADIFTILLVFLLKSYAVGATTITPSSGMKLPQAHAGEANLDALKVELSQSGVMIEGQPAAELSDFHFQPSDVEPNGASKALEGALQKSRDRQLLIAKANSDVKVDPRIIVVADERAPYQTVKTVLASAALHGYTDFKLAVIKGE